MNDLHWKQWVELGKTDGVFETRLTYLNAHGTWRARYWLDEGGIEEFTSDSAAGAVLQAITAMGKKE